MMEAGELLGMSETAVPPLPGSVEAEELRYAPQGAFGAAGHGTLRNEAANYRLAQKQAAEAIGVLWNARLDLAISSGDVESIERALTRPVSRVAFYDNCNCGGGGTSYW